MLLPKDILAGTYTKPKLFLCETDKSKICELHTTAMNGSFKFNAYSELEFTVGRTYEDFMSGEQKVNPFYNKIEALRLVELDGFGFFEIQDPELVSNGIMECKNVVAHSLEYNLSQKYLDNLNINTGELNSLEVVYAEDEKNIVPITFYNISNPKLSLLHIILEKIYGWSIGHVDDSLKTMSRTFEISRSSVYDFIMQDICDKFNCFAVFDTINNKINFYAETLITKFIGNGIKKSFIISPAYDSISSVSIQGYRTTDYVYDSSTGILTFGTAPEKESLIEVADGSQEKWKTDVYVTFENLAQEVNVSYNADDIKTVLTVKGAEDLDIREVNMGLPYITDLSYYYSVDWMGQELYDAYTKYLEKCESVKASYKESIQPMLELNNHIWYERNRLSLQYTGVPDVTSKTEGIYYVRGGTEPNYYYVEVSLPAEYSAEVSKYYSLFGNRINETKVSNLYTAIQKYYISRDITGFNKIESDFAFMKKYTIAYLRDALSKASTVPAMDNIISNFLGEMWEQLGLTPLKVLYYEPYKGIKETNIKAGWSNASSEHYWEYYPVNVMLDSINKAMNIRQQLIDEYTSQYEKIENQTNKITNEVLIDVFFVQYFKDKGLNIDEAKSKANKLLVRLNPFLREDEYNDDNFVVTNADTIASSIRTKQELLECGKIELSKLCEPKLAFSMDMANIYALPEFAPIVKQFQLGYLINVVIRSDYVKRARLLEVDINFHDFSDFSCEFGELTNLRTPSSIHADLLANALTAGKSVTSNVSYWNRGADLATSTDLKIQQGLLDAVNGLYSSSQGVVIDKNGILLTKIINTETGEVSPNQAWIVNNNILFSSDGFKTAEVGLGEFTIDGTTFYGLLAQAVLSGYIEGSTIVGGTLNIGNGTFAVDSNGKMKATSGSIAGWTINKSNLLKELTINDIDYQMYLQAPNGDSTLNAFAVRSKDVDSDTWETQFAVNYKGKLLAKNADITGAITATSLTLGDGVKIPYENLSSVPDLDIYISKDGIVGKTPAEGVTGFKVSKSGLLEASNAVIYGDIYASAGNIGGWTIYSELLRKEVTIDDITYQMYMQPADGVNTTNAFAVRKKSTSDTSWDTQFAVNYAGKLTAKNANITGTITAKDGSIAGYNIGSGGSYDNAIYKRVTGDSAKYEVGIKATSGETDLAFYVKESTDSWASSENTFYVNNKGKLYAQNADITGKITASSGTIGGWTIGESKIYGTSDTGNVAVMQLPTSSTTFVFAAGGTSHSSYSSCPFRVTKDGKLYASKGNIGGFVIDDDRLICREDNSDTSASLAYMSLNAYSYDTSNHNAIIVGTRSSSSDDYTTQFRVRYDGSVYMRNATITGDSTIESACIPNLNASKITAGTLDVDRIPNISAGKITSGTISTARLDASVITTGNFSSKTLSTGNLSVTSGGNIGIWTVNSNNYLYAISGSYGVSLSATSVSHGQGGSTTWVNIVKAGQNASDERLKKNISTFDDTIDSIFDNLKPVQFEYSKEFLGQGTHFGYIAQDVVKAFEDEGKNIDDYSFVYETELEDNSTEKYYQLNQTDFISLNTWQIQKLKKRIEELENKLAALEM